MPYGGGGRAPAVIESGRSPFPRTELSSPLCAICLLQLERGEPYQSESRACAYRWEHQRCATKSAHAAGEARSAASGRADDHG